VDSLAHSERDELPIVMTDPSIRRRRVSVVTGGGHGIGRATCSALAREGYAVHCIDIDDDAGLEAIADVLSVGGDGAFHHADFSVVGSATAAIESVLEASGGILDVVVNNAFRYERGRSLTSMSEDDWNADLRLLLLSYAEVVRASVTALLPGASIVNLASIRGFFAGVDWGSYSVAKAAVAQLTRALAAELAPRQVRVNAVAPGAIATARMQALPEVARDRLASVIPLGRLGDPSEIADVITFLVSERARYMTGQVVIVDGGLALPLQLDSLDMYDAWRESL
jgi:3-oxoacyl-[acyl-carrier protein] reductase